SGFNIVKHHCDACNKTSYSFLKEENCCHHTEKPAKVSHKASCCQKAEENSVKQEEKCSSCKNVLLFVKLNERFLSESFIINKLSIDFINNLSPENTNTQIQFFPEVLNLNYCGPPFVRTGKELLISFHSLKLDC
ncbi:MAG: hypothetical protein WCH34_17960, partial [Bacteroidota bacterium]